ncbi:MAG: histidine phosphatase family protein [Desulfobacteraceae bacterium]|jgi:broad specificity phosphatase PhoE|nr:MAG: histidine phosphatase family protein [Desulfobacteraceae bacterium]
MGLIYLIRHGQTMWNKEEVFRGQSDIPLNDFGRQQASAIAKELQEKKLQNPVFFSSPLKRARETAEIASSFLPGISVIDIEALIDIHFGEWQGQAKEKIEKLYPELYRMWLESPAEVVFPGGEDLKKVADRAEKAFIAIAREHMENDVIIVTHRVINKVLLCRLLGAGFDSFWKIRQDTACINILTWEHFLFNMLVINDTCHLRPLGKGDLRDF